MTTYTDFEEARIKHLEMIQEIVKRLAGNGFLMKGWALTLAVALLGFAVERQNWVLALVSIVPTLAFWGLDAYFLWAERLFRELYRRVVEFDESIRPFSMAATGKSFRDEVTDEVSSFWKTCFRRPVLPGFYCTLLVAAVLVIGVTLATTGQQ